MIAYLVSHNGLGDNLYMVGALHFINQFYEKVYFLCKNKYYNNVKLFFSQSSNIICIPFNELNEFYEIYNILFHKYEDNNIDIFICGLHKQYLKNKITNKDYLNNKIVNNNYDIEWDTINKYNYKFIEQFYKDINLNLTYFYEYFYLPSTVESIRLLNLVKEFYIIFIQLKSSDGIKLNISELKKEYINDDKVILLCNDINLYKEDNNKYILAQQFVMNDIINYLDTIKFSDEIYIIDSCFVGIVLPLLKTNKLKTKKVRIIYRSLANSIFL